MGVTLIRVIDKPVVVDEPAVVAQSSVHYDEPSEDIPAHPCTHNNLMRVKMFAGESVEEVEEKVNAWLFKHFIVSPLAIKMSARPGMIAVLIQYEYDHVPKKKGEDED
jgi:hypothetical protein